MPSDRRTSPVHGRRGRGLGAGFGLLALLAASAGDATAADDPRPGRYTMTPADGGFVRLDTETGSMALCAKRGDQWSCDPMPDAQASQKREVESITVKVCSMLVKCVFE